MVSWTLWVGGTALLFWALTSSMDRVDSALVVSVYDEADTHEALERCAGAAAICGTIRVSPELEPFMPKTGVLYIRATNSALGSSEVVVSKKIPASPPPVRYRIGPADMLVPGGLSKELEIEVHWSASGSMERLPGDLTGRCGKMPLYPGDRVANLVLGKRL